MERREDQNLQSTVLEEGQDSKLAEYGDCMEIPCGLRMEDINTLPDEIRFHTATHTNGAAAARKAQQF
jgi:hypothetical protein